MKVSVIDKISTLLQAAMAPHSDISAFALYVQDPCWPSSMRLVCAPGVTIPEAAHGIRLPLPPELTKCSESYHADARTDKISRELRSVKALLSRPDESYLLFGNFIVREQIASRVWHYHWDGEVLSALLSASYRQPLKKASWSLLERQFLSDLFHKKIVPLLPTLTSRLLSQSAYRFRALVQIISTPIETSAIRDGEEPAPKESHRFDGIMNAALKAFDIRDDGFATVHLLQPDGKILLRVAEYGQLETLKPREQSLENGHGVVSWVALRKQPVLIGDLPNSRFGQIHVPLRNNIHSELAVPLLDGDELLGVVNIECERPHHFPPESVGILSYAATQVAIACKLDEAERKAQLESDVLRLCSNLPLTMREHAQGTPTTLPLDSLAQIACQFLRIEDCDIWRFATDHFVPVGATIKVSPDRAPRVGGWTEYVYAHRRPVYVSQTCNPDSYVAQEFDSVTGCWTGPGHAGQILPVKPRVPKRSRAKLGLPLLIRVSDGEAKCLGVAWFNCNEPCSDPVALRILQSDAETFIGPCTLALAFIENEERLRNDAFSLLTWVFHHDAGNVLEKLLECIQNARTPDRFIAERADWLTYLSYLNSYLLTAAQPA